MEHEAQSQGDKPSYYTARTGSSVLHQITIKDLHFQITCSMISRRNTELFASACNIFPLKVASPLLVSSELRCCNNRGITFSDETFQHLAFRE